jgi:beta-glucuronidase
MVTPRLNNLSAQPATLDPTMEMVQVDGIWVPLQNGVVYPNYDPKQETVINLGGAVWKKERQSMDDGVSLTNRLDDGGAGLQAVELEGGGRHLVSFDDSGWVSAAVPEVENVMPPYEVNNPEAYYDGVWYRREFSVPPTFAEKEIYLYFESVNYVCDVWINDTYIGYHEGGYTPFSFEVTDFISRNGTNHISVRVDNPEWVWDGRKDIIPSVICDWFNYTGIIQDVKLIAKPTIYLGRVDVRAENNSGDVSIMSVLVNKTTAPQNVELEYFIYNADVGTDDLLKSNDEVLGAIATVTDNVSSGISVSENSLRAVVKNLNVSNAQTWSPANPSLYIAEIVLKDSSSGDTIDTSYVQFGFRTVGTESDGALTINGRRVFLPGIARHEEWPDSGRTATPEKILADLEIIRNDLKCLFLRTAHYPNHPLTYLLADRLGLVVMEEIPAWWFDPAQFREQNRTFADTPSSTTAEGRHITLQMWREMILRDRNRPSILFWSTNNEGRGEGEGTDQEWRTAFMDELKNDRDTYYPDDRFIVQSPASDDPGVQDKSQNPADAVGWTMYYDVFYGNDAYAETKAFIQAIETQQPGKPIIATEFGVWDGGDKSEAEQVRIFTETFRAFSEEASLDSLGQAQSGNALSVVCWWTAFNWYRVAPFVQTMGIRHMDRTTSKAVEATMVNAYSPYHALGGEEALSVQTAIMHTY